MVYTDDEFDIDFPNILPPPDEYLIFQVKACRDAHMVLSVMSNADQPCWDITLGGANNTVFSISDGVKVNYAQVSH